MEYDIISLALCAAGIYMFSANNDATLVNNIDVQVTVFDGNLEKVVVASLPYVTQIIRINNLSAG